MDKNKIKLGYPAIRTFISNRGKEHQNPSKNAVYGFIDSKGELKVVEYHYCYAALNQSRGYVPDDVEAVLLQVQDYPDWVGDDAARHYWEWLFNLSPVRSAFASKNINKVMKNKLIVLDVDADAGFIGLGAIAARQPWEHYADKYNSGFQTKLWWDFVQAGVDPNEAFLITQAAQIKRDGTNPVFDMLTFANHRSGHAPMDGYSRTFVNFLKNKPELKGIYRKKLSYGSTNLVFNPTGDSSMAIGDAIIKFTKDIASEKKNNNIFDMQVTTAFIKRDKVIEAAKDYASLLQEKVKAYG